MIALLDTGVFLWWLDDPGRLSEAALQEISDRANTIIVSAVVPWELAVKSSLGKVRAQTLLAQWPSRLALLDFRELAIHSEHAIRAGLLPRHHHDPFDRLLIAQSVATAWPVITPDKIFETYGVRRIW